MLVDAMAVARLARLLTRDEIASPIRARVMMAVDDGKLPAQAEALVRCTWCSAVWIAGGALLARRFVPRAWRPLARVLAVSQLAGMLQPPALGAPERVY